MTHRGKNSWLLLLALVVFGAMRASASQFAYVATLSGNVSAYAVDEATGALNPVPGSPFAAGWGPDAVAVTPEGTFAYVANRYSGDVSAYAINRADGRLSQIAGSPFGAGTYPWSIKIGVDLESWTGEQV